MSAIGGISPASISIDQLSKIYQQSGIASSGADPSAPSRADSFGSMLSNGLSNLEALNQGAQSQAIKAATGDLHEIQDYVIAANKAQIATELTTTLRNKALDSFNEIMRMPL